MKLIDWRRNQGGTTHHYTGRKRVGKEMPLLSLKNSSFCEERAGKENCHDTHPREQSTTSATIEKNPGPSLSVKAKQISESNEKLSDRSDGILLEIMTDSPFSKILPKASGLIQKSNLTTEKRSEKLKNQGAIQHLVEQTQKCSETNCCQNSYSSLSNDPFHQNEFFKRQEKSWKHIELKNDNNSKSKCSGIPQRNTKHDRLESRYNAACRPHLPTLFENLVNNEKALQERFDPVLIAENRALRLRLEMLKDYNYRVSPFRGVFEKMRVLQKENEKLRKENKSLTHTLHSTVSSMKSQMERIMTVTVEQNRQLKRKVNEVEESNQALTKKLAQLSKRSAS